MRQVNWQVSFNPNNNSHKQVMYWVEDQTTNKSSFIRETLTMRMLGMFGTVQTEYQISASLYDAEEAKRLIEV